MTFKHSSTMLLGLWLSGCGGAESSSVAPNVVPILPNTTSLILHAFNPLIYGIESSSSSPNQLTPRTNQLELIEYDAIVEASLNSNKTEAQSVVTGMGIDVVDSAGNPLVVTLGLWAREYDPSTGYFGGTDRVFADHQGADLVGAQYFVIENTNSPNYLLTGLGLRMKNAKVSSLFLQRKTMGGIRSNGDTIDNAVRVELPAGWAAIGFAIKVRPAAGAPTPYIQDALISIAQLLVK